MKWEIQNDTSLPGKGWVVTVGSVWYDVVKLVVSGRF